MLRGGLEKCFYLFVFALYVTVIRCFFLVTNVLRVSHFGQKNLLISLNVNV